MMILFAKVVGERKTEGMASLSGCMPEGTGRGNMWKKRLFSRFAIFFLSFTLLYIGVDTRTGFAGLSYFVTSRGVIPTCCLKIREKYWGDWKPLAKLTSLTDISVLRSSSIALLIRIWFRYSSGERFR